MNPIAFCSPGGYNCSHYQITSQKQSTRIKWCLWIIILKLWHGLIQWSFVTLGTEFFTTTKTLFARTNWCVWIIILKTLTGINPMGISAPGSNTYFHWQITLQNFSTIINWFLNRLILKKLAGIKPMGICDPKINTYFQCEIHLQNFSTTIKSMFVETNPQIFDRY